MAEPLQALTFLESALSVAPLERGEDSWRFIRYCDVLPEEARQDYFFVRAHESGRSKETTPLAGRIAKSMLDRSTPKGRKPDPQRAKAKKLWKLWEDNGFKAPKYVPRWLNHSGTPTKETDDFPPAPEGIGEVLSATTNVHEGRVERDYPASIFFGILIGGLPGALVGFITTQVADLPAVPFTTGSTVVCAMIAYAVHIARNGRAHATWVGSEGIATTTGGVVQVFRFERASRLELKHSNIVSNGQVTGVRAEYTWLNPKNRVVHRARAVLAVNDAEQPDSSPGYFVKAAEEAWNAFEGRDRP